jgi:Domain of unknown function (DU1801)
MTSKASSPDAYVQEVDEARRPAVEQLRATILENIPGGFVEVMSYGSIGYVVPHSLYPDGYHCDPKLPLPFVAMAAQKNSINLYHMGIYADPDLLVWFTDEFPKHSKKKLDMGKSCIRFKSAADIPFQLIGQLLQKMTVEDWVGIYESNLKK